MNEDIIVCREIYKEKYVLLEDCIDAIDRAIKAEKEKCIEIVKRCGIESFCTTRHKAEAEGYRRDIVRALEAGTTEWIDPYKGEQNGTT